MPKAHAELLRVRDLLEKSFRDMQDLEFTIEDGRLYVLQTRNGKRTGFAAVRIASDMVDEGLITEEEAIGRVEPEQLIQLLAPVFDSAKKAPPPPPAASRQGPPRGPGAASGRIALTANRAVEMATEGKPVFPCARKPRRKTSPGERGVRDPDDARGSDESRRGCSARHGKDLRRRRGPDRRR
jgi:pyruvate,orthophosphate dikinase